MKADTFLDTNVLVYAAAGRHDEAAKQARALALLDEPGIGFSSQVLQELYVTLTRKIAVPLPVAEAVEWVDLLATFPVLAVDARLVQRAVGISVRYQVSYWDGAILAAAEGLGCATLYTEDLNHGQHYGPVRALNPFVD